jgi:cytochrome bd-type quinol oxidase subunit 2
MNNQQTNQINNENVLPEIKKPFAFYPIIILIVVLTIVLFLIIYKVKITGGGDSKSSEEIAQNVSIILFFVLLLFVICVILLPNFKGIKTIFEQISNVTYVIIYTIFLILFFRFLPDDTINDYAYIILPVTIILGVFMFYKSSTYSYIDKIDVNYERVKMMILFFCLITVFITYYTIDPGGYITKYFGYSSLLLIIISVFSFLYLIIVLTLPDKVKTAEKGATSSNFLSNFTNISSYGSLIFLVFLITITFVIATYPDGFFTNKDISSSAMVILIIICILWSILLGTSLFPETVDNSIASNKMNLFKRSLLVLFGIVISGLIIGWIIYNVQHYSGQSDITSLLLNIGLTIIVLGLIYKIIVVKLPSGNSKKNAFFNLILNTVLYIPCLFSGLFDKIGKSAFTSVDKETSGGLIMIILLVILIILYFFIPNIINSINVQGGKTLVNQPVSTDVLNTLGTYQDLNESEDYDYQYALSFWVFIESTPNNMVPKLQNNKLSILNYANKPNVLYDINTKSLIITTKQKYLEKNTNNKLIDFDEDGNRILYRNSNIPLQRWNNIVLNYNGGIFDIFLNGELVKSDNGVVPYYTLDNLTVGQDNGMNGGICNVVYFRKALTTNNIFFIYNLVKNMDPPVLNSSNKTILKDNISTIDSSIKTVF